MKLGSAIKSMFKGFADLPNIYAASSWPKNTPAPTRQPFVSKGQIETRDISTPGR